MDLLLNWLAQGVVVTLVAAMVLRAIPRSRPQARYSVAWAASLIVLALPAISHIVANGADAVLSARVESSIDPLITVPATWWTSPVVPLAMWCVWALAYSTRLSAAVVTLRRARRQCLECPAQVQARLPHWSSARWSGRPARLAISRHVRSAALLGGGAPIIALAPALLERVSDTDLDRIVIHEWAHVQRRDDVAQLVEKLVLLLVGWHPGVWWLQRQLEFEREAACDAMAIAVTGSAREYAACLVNVAALPLCRTPASGALAVTAFGVRQRIARILAVRGAAVGRSWRGIAATATLLFGAVAVAAGHVPLVAVARTLEIRAAALSASMAEIAVARRPVDLSVVKVDRRGARPATAPNAARETRLAAPQSDSILAAVPQLPLASAPVAPALMSLDSSSTRALGTNTLPPAGDARSRWSAAAEAGSAIGRGSRQAGVATAGFFNRVGKQIADSF